MKTLFHWSVIGFLALLAIWAFRLSGDLYRAHTTAFLFLWVFMPVIARWLATKRVRSACSVPSLKLLRDFLFVFTAFLSLFSLTEYNHTRDLVGHKFVAGYSVSYSKETDENGQPYLGQDVHTDNWYSAFGLNVFGLLLFGAGLGFPFITWVTASIAIELKKKDLTNGENHP